MTLYFQTLSIGGIYKPFVDVVVDVYGTLFSVNMDIDIVESKVVKQQDCALLCPGFFNIWVHHAVKLVYFCS